MFRGGAKPVLRCRTDTSPAFTRIGSLEKPSLDYLLVLGRTLFPDLGRSSCFVVRSDDGTYGLCDDRDCEELQNDDIVVFGSPPSVLPALKDFPLSRCMLPCNIQAAPGTLRLNENEVLSCGPLMLRAVQSDGYFFVRLEEQTMEFVRGVVTEAAAFFGGEEKKRVGRYGGERGGCQMEGHALQLAHNLGYKNVEGLKKEFYVYRRAEEVKTQNKVDWEVDPLRLKMKDALLGIGRVLRAAAKAMLIAHGTREDDADLKLEGCLDSLKEEKEIGFSSFIEVFQYDCSAGDDLDENILRQEQKYRLSCGEHRDTGILTGIPKSVGDAVGLEMFNWRFGHWFREEQWMESSEMVVFAGELFPWFMGTDVAPLCHRVVVPLIPHGKRISLPVELLPAPTEETIQQISSLACGLKSANY